MKRYIKAAVAEYKTLKGWIDENKGVLDDNTRIEIFDMQPYTGGYGPEDAPGFMFAGTFFELVTGIGENFFVPDEDYNLSDYLNQFDDYELTRINKVCDRYLLTVLHNW